MAVTIGGVTLSDLTAQPFAYQSTDVTRGLTARGWNISGLASHTDWLALIAAYEAWQDVRIDDDDPVESNSVGTTISFSGDGPGGQSWSNVPCWFINPPSGDDAGTKIFFNCTLVDANEQLAVLLRQETIEQEEGDLGDPDLGTLDIGGTILKLTAPLETFSDGPQVSLTAGGSSLISGPRVAVELYTVEGETDLAGFQNILSWYAGIVPTTPTVGEWYPISPPAANAENRIVDGSVTVIYTVGLNLVKMV